MCGDTSSHSQWLTLTEMCVFNQGYQVHGPWGPQASDPRGQDGSGRPRQRSQSHRHRLCRHRLRRGHRAPLPGRTEQHPDHSQCIPSPWNVCSALGCVCALPHAPCAHRPRGRWRSRRWMPTCTVSGWAPSPPDTRPWCLNSSRSSTPWAGLTSWSCVEESFPLRYGQQNFHPPKRLIYLCLSCLSCFLCSVMSEHSVESAGPAQICKVIWFSMPWFNLECLWDGKCSCVVKRWASGGCSLCSVLHHQSLPITGTGWLLS